MRNFFILLFIGLTLDASGTLSVGINHEEKTPMYTIQVFSAKDKENAELMFAKMPKEIQQETHFYQVGEYVAGRYSQNISAEELEISLAKIHQLGVADAYIIKTTDWHLKNNIIKTTSQEQKPQEKEEKQKKQEPNNKISKFSTSSFILKAHEAYKRGDESEAMVYYEMLLASGYASQKIKNNLCYLYGKRGAWSNAKELIEKEQYGSRLIHAYAHGAVSNNDENYYNDLSEYIMIDKSGFLMLLTGHYFEKQEDLGRAASFYKMAYEKNSFDPYTIFAYARVLDMRDDSKALQVYKDALKRTDSSHALYSVVQNRIIQLGEVK